MEVNPFLEWIDRATVRKNGQTFFIPADSILPRIYKVLGVKKFSELLSVEPWITNTFVALWQESNFKKHGIINDGKRVDGALIKNRVEFDDFTVQYISGMLSKPHLNVFLRRALKGDGENDDNPFNQFETNQHVGLPDVAYLPTLYKALGVKKFSETKITQASYERAFVGSNFVKKDDILRIEYRGEDWIGISWLDDSNFYLDRLPSLVVRKLARDIENLKERGKGLMPLAKVLPNVFTSIVQQDIRGKDLISLCRANDQINEYCNWNDQQLFKSRLVSEFGEKWQPGYHGYDFPRDLYVQMHKLYYDVIVNEDGDFDLERFEDGEVNKQAYILRFVPGPTWDEDEEEGLSYKLFFFPIAPKLSFVTTVVAQADSVEAVGFIHTENIEAYVDEADLPTFVEESIEYGDRFDYVDGPSIVSTFFRKLHETVPSVDIKDDQVYILSLL
uniref:Uncharacterized protein n=1 Tax=viral metagenome TaxID=1070528 RepID=A0A6C0CIR2_9ZZZZ